MQKRDVVPESKDDKFLIRDERLGMRQMMFGKIVSVVICALLLCVLTPMSAVADQGRLSQVIDGQGNVATYTYDAVGNLLSITRNTGGVGALFVSQ